MLIIHLLAVRICLTKVPPAYMHTHIGKNPYITKQQSIESFHPVQSSYWLYS